ncbi:arginine repressor [Clostridium thermosuccinogenes]|jgi:transcriptional regulator of arginine metabolism|uniref:Arginine repressor n=1 Tax=Clostridium thermosuccinogenes TaxID=84032 RepID=A0A2K2FIZ9_9CLOT|nr:arginine repressor [Pseudoclostridium thermosuccinogenes]AUS96176.1 arginine repressor [Pseudoclostridium thermosuccinogenes]PNT93141.1 arginine repressor [Pseudoclostridium thermosuccinogenes]PNT98756.1 arginine repressor [Pseudoclostridium thermosuccinogenes]PNU00755.1 arginine repressor [Pseudoclostridium thermosuccinogenes]
MKYNRQAKILELIDRYAIETQEELAEKLKEMGMDVTQATISRDIKELRLIKVMTEDGKYKYAPFSQTENMLSNKLLTIFAESFVSCDYANNIVIVKTLPGMAQAAASAVDSLKWIEILGTIAGDDTIMIVCRAEKFAEELVEKFNRMKK